MNEKIVTFRVDEKIKSDFEKYAKSIDMTTSQILRKFMKDIAESSRKGKNSGRKD